MGILIVSGRHARGDFDGRRAATGRPRGLLLALSALVALVASPAAAGPIGDCFERIAVAFHPHPAHPATAVHRVAPRHPRPRHVAAHALGARYILRPRACETHPAVALMSPAPGAAIPETPQMLLAELAGPAAATSPHVTTDTAERGPVVAETPATPGNIFSLGVGGSGSGPGGGFPGSPNFPPVTTPVIELPPGVTQIPPPAPPIQPPEGPGGVFPPTTPLTPVVLVVPIVDLPGPGGPSGGVPEPATWAFLILGVFGVGETLRRGAAQP